MICVACGGSASSPAPPPNAPRSEAKPSSIISCPAGFSAHPQLDERVGPAASLAQLCEVIRAGLRDEYFGSEPQECHELPPLADGFSLLQVNLAAEIRYLIVGRASDGWYALGRITSTFPGDQTEATFDISNVEARVVQGRGTLLRLHTATQVRSRNASRLEEREVTHNDTTVCGRSTDARQQACFTLLTWSSWTTYPLRQAAERGGVGLERAGAAIRSTQLKAQLELSEDGTIRNEMDYESLEDAGDPRCYTWAHNVFDWDYADSGLTARR